MARITGLRAPQRVGRTLVRMPSADTCCPGRPGTRARDTLCHTFVQRLVAPHTLKPGKPGSR
jgi:hypothetical protein